MTDINKLIEEEAERSTRYAFAQLSFIEGANFILYLNRWRKVSEELPEVRKEPYPIAIRVINVPTSASMWNIRDEDDLRVFNNMRGCEWKPIE